MLLVGLPRCGVRLLVVFRQSSSDGATRRPYQDKTESIATGD
jgi:hypothetical protein